jgi:seryl-tRNA(Sec) selenium transferase
MRLYENLGLKTYITWGGNGTADGGSIMFPEVLEALADASRSFIRTSDLHERAGRQLAKLIGVEAAYITSGAAAGVAIAVAACLTGKDWSKVHRLPDLPGEKPEGIIVPALRTGMMVSPQCLEPGEEVILAQRIKQVLKGQSG